MVCCIAAVAVMAVIGKVFRRPVGWIRGKDTSCAVSSMPAPARYGPALVRSDPAGAR